MKLLAKICTACLFLGTFLSGSVLAHSTPYNHYHATPKKKKKVKVVYRTTPAPAKSVRVVTTKTVVSPRVTIKPRITVNTSPITRPSKATVVVSAADRGDDVPLKTSPLSMGLRGIANHAADQGRSDAQVTMGGAGATLRSRLDSDFGIELSLDVLAGKGSDFTQTTIPLFASATYHFLPGYAFQPYVLVGVGADFSRKEALGGNLAYDKVDLGAQAGMGAELFLTQNISLTGDVRFKAMGNVSTETQLDQNCLSTSGSMSGFCDDIQSVTPGDDHHLGVQFGIGANIYF